MMKTIIQFTIAFLPFTMLAQQEYSFTQYFEANSFYNPAAAGSKNMHSFNAIFRKQWVGFEGSPITGGLVYDTRLDRFNMGLGGYFFSDKSGATTMTNVALNYSYALKFGDKMRLAFGLDGGVDIYSTDYNSLIYWENEDPMFTNQKQTMTIPRAGVGAQFYTDDYYFGIAVPRLINFNNETALSINAPQFPSVVSNYYLSAGYRFDVGNTFELQFNVLGKYTSHVRPQGDISVMGTYRKMIGLGLGYKSLGFGSVFLQYTYGEIVTIGYAFDMTLTDMSRYSNGSHEIMIQYLIPRKSKEARSSLGK